MREQRGITEFRFDWTDYFAMHIALGDELAGWYVDLVTMASGVLDGRAIDHAVETRPKDRSHTHRARFTRGVKCVAPEEMIFDSSASKPDRIDFGVTGWIVLLRGLIDSSHEQLARLSIYNHGSKWDGRICGHGSLSESDQTNHLLLIKRRACGRLDF